MIRAIGRPYAGRDFCVKNTVTESQGTRLPAVNRAVRLIALPELGYFGIEFAVARAIGSASFADSLDFLEDTAVNGLILAALGWSAHRRLIVGMILAAILFAPP